MGGREVGGLATMLAAHMDFVPDDLQRLARFWGRTAGADRADCWSCLPPLRRGQSGLDHGYQPGGVVRQPRGEPGAGRLSAGDHLGCRPDRYRTFRPHPLSSAGLGEKNGTVTNSERRISRQRSFLPPPGRRKDWWIIARVGQALGHREAFYWQHPHTTSSASMASGFETTARRLISARAGDPAVRRGTPCRRCWPVSHQRGRPGISRAAGRRWQAADGAGDAQPTRRQPMPFIR